MRLHENNFTTAFAREMTPSVPLWAVGAVAIVVGPWIVNRIAKAFSKKIEQRTDDAIAAMTPRGGASAPGGASAEPPPKEQSDHDTR